MVDLTCPLMERLYDIRVSNGSRHRASGHGLDWKDNSVQFVNCPKTRPDTSCQAKSGPIPIDLQITPGLDRPVWFQSLVLHFGFPIYGRIQICYS